MHYHADTMPAKNACEGVGSIRRRSLLEQQGISKSAATNSHTTADK